MHPLHLLIGGLANFFTISVLAADVYFFREWYRYKEASEEVLRNADYTTNHARNCLIVAIGLLALTFLGRLIFGLFLGKFGKDEPNQDRSSEGVDLQRPEGHTLHVEFYGSPKAQPIIMLHGWSSNSTQWYYFKKTLSKDYRLLLVDLPGLGKSGKPANNDYSLAKFSRDLEAVIDLCSDQKPLVLGHSIGGMTILSACKIMGPSFYSKVSGLVLVQTTYTNPCKTSILSGLLLALQKPVLTPILYIMIGLAPLFQLMNWLKYLNGSMHLSNALTGFAGTETKGQLNLTALLSTIAPIDVVARGCLAMFDYDAISTLQTISLPVLVVAGKQDILIKKRACSYITEYIPNAQLVTLAPSGHMGVLERNAEMVSAVSAFAKATFAGTERASGFSLKQ